MTPLFVPDTLRWMSQASGHLESMSSALQDAARNLSEKAQWSSVHRANEAGLRSDLFTVLQPYAEQIVRVLPEDIRQEGTGKSGRFDSMFGRAIFEYKRPGLLDSQAERREAALQGIGYLEDITLGAQVVIITDGTTWGFLRDPEAGAEPGEQTWLFGESDGSATQAEQRFVWHPNGEGTARRVLLLLNTLKSAPVSPLSVTSRLGIQRPEVMRLIRVLADRLADRATEGRTDVLFKQWIQLAGVAYGITDQITPFPMPAERMLGGELSQAISRAGFGGSVFVLHTYVSLASKFLATELLALIQGTPNLQPTEWIVLGRREFARQLRALEQGSVTERLSARAMFASDLFGWWASLVETDPELDDAIRGVVQALAELAWARVANAGGIAVDLLRSLYQGIVPAPLRKALGEFFTPRWVAERVLFQALDLLHLGHDQPPRILDPSCGSGTFLVAALRHGLGQLGSKGLDEDPEALAALVSSIIGFDINPVAPLMTKVNLLLALGDRARFLPAIDFRVYQADSILLPEFDVGQSNLMGHMIQTERLPLEIGAIQLPSALATLNGMALLRRHIDIGVANRRSEATFLARLAADLVELVPSSDLPEALELCSQLYERIQQLASAGKNGVWSHIIEQAFAPRAVGQVDLVVGNPPWVSWKSLPPAWKDRSEQTWRQWGLWQSGRASVPLSDVSTLLVARSLATYCPGGVVAFLLPRSVLIADPSGTKLRRCRLRPNAEDSIGPDDPVVAYRPLHVDDFSELHPFSPDAANEPVALYLRAGEAAHSDLRFPADRWVRSLPRTRIVPTDPWSLVHSELLRQEHFEMAPVDTADLGSPWASRPNPGEVPLVTGSTAPAYTWGRGFETRGVDGILMVEVTSPPVAAGVQPRLVTISTRPDLGKNSRALTAVERPVEPTLIWPLIKGSEVQPWRVRRRGLYAIVAHDPADPRKVLNEAELIRLSGHLFDYLEPHLDTLRARSLYRSRTPNAGEGPWGWSGPLEHLDETAHVILVRYIATRGRPAAAVVGPELDPLLAATPFRSRTIRAMCISLVTQTRRTTWRDGSTQHPCKMHCSGSPRQQVSHRGP